MPDFDRLLELPYVRDGRHVLALLVRRVGAVAPVRKPRVNLLLRDATCAHKQDRSKWSCELRNKATHVGYHEGVETGSESARKWVKQEEKTTHNKAS